MAEEAQTPLILDLRKSSWSENVRAASAGGAITTAAADSHITEQI